MGNHQRKKTKKERNSVLCQSRLRPFNTLSFSFYVMLIKPTEPVSAVIVQLCQPPCSQWSSCYVSPLISNMWFSHMWVSICVFLCLGFSQYTISIQAFERERETGWFWKLMVNVFWENYVGDSFVSYAHLELNTLKLDFVHVIKYRTDKCRF